MFASAVEIVAISTLGKWEPTFEAKVKNGREILFRVATDFTFFFTLRVSLWTSVSFFLLFAWTWVANDFPDLPARLLTFVLRDLGVNPNVFPTCQCDISWCVCILRVSVLKSWVLKSAEHSTYSIFMGDKWGTVLNHVNTEGRIPWNIARCARILLFVFQVLMDYQTTRDKLDSLLWSYLPLKHKYRIIDSNIGFE